MRIHSASPSMDLDDLNFGDSPSLLNLDEAMTPSDAIQSPAQDLFDEFVDTSMLEDSAMKESSREPSATTPALVSDNPLDAPDGPRPDAEDGRRR
jgi:hypothetical protein